MSQRIIALPGDADHEWQLNLSQLREGTLNALYLLTYVVGFALVAIAMAFPKVWAAGGLGILFLVIPYPLRTLASASVLARAWVLIVLWFGASIAGAFLWPEALIVLAMVVAFARLLVGMAAGVGVALGASLVVGWFAYSHHIAPQGLSAAIGIWGGLIVLSLGIYPIYAAMRWSWSQYDHVRRQADHVRDAQSELKQAVEELVEKGVQMARLNQLLGEVQMYKNAIGPYALYG